MTFHINWDHEDSSPTSGRNMMKKVRDVENITHFINGCILGLSKLSQEGIAHLIDCNCRASRFVTSYSQCWKSSVFSSKYRMNYDELFGNVWGMEDSEGKCSMDSMDGFDFILYRPHLLCLCNLHPNSLQLVSFLQPFHVQVPTCKLPGFGRPKAEKPTMLRWNYQK